MPKTLQKFVDLRGDYHEFGTAACKVWLLVATATRPRFNKKRAEQEGGRATSGLRVLMSHEG